MAVAGWVKRTKRRLSLFDLRNTKLTRKHLERLCADHASLEPTLVAHLEFDPRRYFPNATAMDDGIDTRTQINEQCRDLDEIPPESYRIIVCSGLLEHIADPQRVLDAFHRILTPGGKLILSVSAVFSFHGCPHDYFHFTPYSMRLLLKRWRDVSIRGNSQPFETIGILLQRITLQCELSRLFRVMVELAAQVAPFFDRFISRQYNSLLAYRDEECRTDSMMPSNLQVVALK